MNRPAQQPLGRPSEPALHNEPSLSLQTLQAIALAQRPEMQRAQRRLETEKARLQVANRQWFADPAVNVKAQRYNSAEQAVSEVDVGVSMPIPWTNWKKYSAAVAEARKSVESAEAELEAARTETLGLVRDQLKKVQTANEQYRIYSTLILPLARQTVEASRASYEASASGFLELVTARRTMQDAESTTLNRIADYETALAELDALIGRETLSLNGGKE
jgi:outer membrane protein TolC